MKLTKRQEKQLIKSFDNPKKLRKWIDDVYNEMISRCQQKTEKSVFEYLDIYSITVAYVLHYICGFGKKRLPIVMEKIWDTFDSFTKGYLSLEDCIQELEKNNVKFDTIIKNPSDWKGLINDNK